MPATKDRTRCMPASTAAGAAPAHLPDHVLPRPAVLRQRVLVGVDAEWTQAADFR